MIAFVLGMIVGAGCIYSIDSVSCWIEDRRYRRNVQRLDDELRRMRGAKP